MALSGSLKITAALSNALDGVDLSTPSETVNQSAQKILSSGVLYHDTVDLTDGGTADLDVTDDSLSDVFGNTIAMTVVTGIYIKAHTTNTTDVTVVTGTTPILPTLPPLSAGEGFSYLANIDVSTNGILHLSNGVGAAAKVDVIIVGTEA